MKWLRIRKWLVLKLGGETYWLDDQIEEVERSWQESLWAAQNVRLDGLRLVNNAITMLDPDTSTFKTMLSKQPGAAEVKYHWLEDELFPRISNPPVTFDWKWPQVPAQARMVP